nr:MAG TPA: hypothetical protein [Bacteriophage sp.]
MMILLIIMLHLISLLEQENVIFICEELRGKHLKN